MSKVDEQLDDALIAVQGLLRRIELTQEEIEYVDDAGRAVFEFAFNHFVNGPEKQRMELRPLVIAMATALALGGSSLWEQGIASLKQNDEPEARWR